MAIQDLPHLEEDVAELLADLHERMERSSCRRDSLGVEVVLLERSLLPVTPSYAQSQL